jgi:glycosyltransferase involved in cell wall biosynthesis
LEPRVDFSGRHVVFIVNVDWFFESHRLPVAIELMKSGAEVSLVTAITDRGEAIAAHGIRVIELGVSRSGRDPREMVAAVRQLRSVLADVGPALVHNVAAKPVLAGSIAAASIDRTLPVVNAISGFGHLLSDPEVGRWLPRIARSSYRVALRAPRRTRVVVQNEGARRELCAQRMARPADVRLIPGMGVDTRRFRPGGGAGRPVPTVMLASRLIRSKGIVEFAEAASLLRRSHPDARFRLVGTPDPGNPLSMDEDAVRKLAARHGVEWAGGTQDMPEAMREADVFVLPTYHEGLPKVLLEAAASGLAIVASDIPGCRQIVRDGVEAVLVPPRDARSLADAIGQLVDCPDRRRQLAAAARARVLDEFTLEHAVAAHLDLYAELLGT